MTRDRNKLIENVTPKGRVFRWFKSLNHLIASCTANYDWPFGNTSFWTFLLKFGHKGP